MSGGERLIQIAIVSEDKQISDGIEAFCGICCAAQGKPYRCTAFADVDSFAAALYPAMYAVIISSCAGGEKALARLRAAVPQAGIILYAEDACTSMCGYAIDASGFLTLPIGYEPFAESFERACRRAQKERGNNLLVKDGWEFRRISVKDVRFVEVSGHFLIYHLFDGAVTLRGQLRGVEKRLEQEGFYRCSVKYMVNLRYIECPARNVVRVGSSEIPVSRRRRGDFYGRLRGSGRLGAPPCEGAPVS